METKPQSIELYSIQADGAAPECGELSSARLSIRRARPGEAGGVTHLEAQLCPLTRPPIWLYRTITYAHVVQSIYYMSQYFNPNMYYPLSAMRAMRKIKSPPSCFPRIKNRIRTLGVKRPNCEFQSRP